ncbi:hypothetical protein GE09DRAFT_1180100 [Coniochaeta sp. 2T2.1]|nr:hypothetical protein GE09DRAFT_1180100 [Coniochaeta sp. 2T2.1]
MELSAQLLPRLGVVVLVGFVQLFGKICLQLLRLRQYPEGDRVRRVNKKDHERIPGQWNPSDFRTLKPRPYPDWSIETTKPLPYRAFRYGPKAERIAKTAPEAIPAAMELLEELTDYFPCRYPSLFRRTAVGIDNSWSGESFNLVERPLKEDPIAICGRLVQDDLALMMERPDGQYYLLSGAIILPGFWRLEDKFGMPLSEIHTSGRVPQFKEKLERGMLSFFTRLKCETMYSRNNYFIQVDDSLAWSWSIGSEDDPNISFQTAEKHRAIEHHWFRSERQTLRRLPKTGAVVFTIRTYFHPIVDIAQEDYGREKYGDGLLEYLDREHEKQLEKGLDVDKEDARQYPW